VSDLTIDKIREIISSEALGHIRMCDILRERNDNFVIRTFPGCYDKDTEILTKNRGWLLFKNLKMDDEVASLDKEHNIFYTKPTAIQKYHYKGEMIKINHRSVNLLVTPNHKLYLKKYKTKQQYQFYEANNIPVNKVQTINKTHWIGEEKEYFTYGKEKFLMDDFLEFLGWYISDGNVNHSGRSHSIFIRQVKKENHKQIKDLLERMGVNSSLYYNSKFYFSSIDLHKYLKPLGKAQDKYIPQEFMNLSKRQLQILFNALIKGDGNIRRNREISYCTISKKLADQIQEIIIKIGLNSTMTSRIRKNVYFKKENRLIKNHHRIYEIRVRNNKYCLLQKTRNHFLKQFYDDMVYCCTVEPYHTLLVRRNGRPVWCGNSGKTTSVMKAIDKAGYTWIYLAPFHDIIKDNLKYSKQREYDFIHLKGKDQPGMCLSEEYSNYAKQGLSITPFCESRCPLKDDGCPYYEIKREIETFPQCWAGVHAHVPTYLQSFLYDVEYEGRKMFNHFDAIIIDEFPFQVLYDQVIVSKRDINNVRDILEVMEEDTREKDFMRSFLDELTLVTRKIDVNFERLMGLLRDNRGLELKKFLERYDYRLLKLFEKEKIVEPPKRLLFNIFKIYEANPDFEKIRWMVYKNYTGNWNRKGIYLTVPNTKYFTNFNIPVVVLDATANIRIWGSLLGKPVESDHHLDIDIEYKNLYQLRTGARYPTSSWVKLRDKKYVLQSSGFKLCELIQHICSTKKRSVLICGTKKITRLIKEYLEENYKRKNYMFGIYYNLRSRNNFYEECDTCILAHEPHIPELQMSILANIIDWDESLLRELMTECEMRQALGRVRQNIIETPSGRKRYKKDKGIELYCLPGSYYESTKIDPKAILVSYDRMFTKDRRSLFEILRDIIEKKESTTIKELRELTGISEKILKGELLRLYKNKYISNYKRSIEWIYDEEKAHKPKYKVNNHYGNY
jgi:hypothetical protein